MTVAETILAQLGGNKFRVMTGAKNFVSSTYSLSFDIPKSKDGINKVWIQLTTNDSYDIVFYSIRGTKINEVAKIEDIYTEQLIPIFEERTGLLTRL